MAGFVGYIVHANDIRWPWKMPGDVPTGLSPQALWDAIPEAAKWQIILFVGFLEFWRENAFVLKEDGQTHYMRGGKPGYFPTFSQLPHPVTPAAPPAAHARAPARRRARPDPSHTHPHAHQVPFKFFDPFNLSAGMSAEKKAKSLLAEVNNGRFAM